MFSYWLRCALISIAAVLGACAGIDPYLVPPASGWLARGSAGDERAGATRCVEDYERVDRAVDAYRVRDGGETRVPGFPYLRIDRFHAMLGAQPSLDPAGAGFDAPAFDRWVQRLRMIDARARGFELANLEGATGWPSQRVAATRERLAHCAELLASVDLASRDARARLVEVAVVPPDYDSWKRVLGLYPLTGWPFLAGVRAYQAETVGRFASSGIESRVADRLVRYVPAADPSVGASGAIYGKLARDRLGVPEPTDRELAALFAAHAPIFEVEQRGGADRIGEVRLVSGPFELSRTPGAAIAAVDPSAPVVYQRLAFTRWHGRVLMQLVYTVWFPERPLSGAFDLLGGRLDALVWRVTLGDDGLPLVYDSMHACGCYHMFFPTAAVRERTSSTVFDEGALVPRQAPKLAPGERMVLRVQAGTHYIGQLLRERDLRDSGAAGDRGYARVILRTEAENVLRSLPVPGGLRRSLYRADGIVPGSERAERYLFWPMGIREPGAMRQWGRHATAFVGMRHFDDADLIERYFAPSVERGTRNIEYHRPLFDERQAHG